MRLTVIGCSGSYPGPDSPASCYLLEAEHDGPRRWRVLMDLGSGALGALHLYVDPLSIDAVAAQPPARRPLPRPVRLLRAAQVPPDGPAAPASGVGAQRHRRPDGARLRPARGPGHDRGVRLPHLRRRGRDRAVQGGGGAGAAPGRGLRAAGRPWGTRRSPTPATPGRARPWTGSRPAPTCCWPRRRSATGRRQPGRRSTSPASTAASSRPRAGVGRLVITHIPPWFDKRDLLAEASSVWDGPAELAQRGAVYEL